MTTITIKDYRSRKTFITTSYRKFDTDNAKRYQLDYKLNVDCAMAFAASINSLEN